MIFFPARPIPSREYCAILLGVFCCLLLLFVVLWEALFMDDGCMTTDGGGGASECFFFHCFVHSFIATTRRPTCVFRVFFFIHWISPSHSNRLYSIFPSSVGFCCHFFLPRIPRTLNITFLMSNTRWDSYDGTFAGEKKVREKKNTGNSLCNTPDESGPLCSHRCAPYRKRRYTFSGNFFCFSFFACSSFVRLLGSWFSRGVWDRCASLMWVFESVLVCLWIMSVYAKAQAYARVDTWRRNLYTRGDPHREHRDHHRRYLWPLQFILRHLFMSWQPPCRIKIAEQNLVIARDGVCVRMLFISTIFFFCLSLSPSSSSSSASMAFCF